MLSSGPRLATALRIVTVLAACALLPLFVDLGSVGGVLANAALLPLVCAVALNLLTRAAAAERNLTLCRAGQLPIGRWQALESLFIANFWSLALPGVSAGAVATVLRYRHYGVSSPHALAVLAASRLIEMTAFAGLAAVGLLWAAGGGADGSLLHASLLGGVVAAGSLLRRLPAQSVLAGAGWATLQGALDAATLMVLANSIGLRVDLAHALSVNALSYFTILLPISVAGLGVREAAIVLALTPLGVGREQAVALALLMLAMTLVNAALGGLLQARAALWSDRRAQRRA